MSDRIEHVRDFAKRVIAELRHREDSLAARVLEFDLEDRERKASQSDRGAWRGFRLTVEKYEEFSRRLP